ncbi:MAG: hypothetical protein LIO52_07905 [Oscillospiraceae bacterium]|nr:hypothetical protein [Oscillospiraceae bacterium]
MKIALGYIITYLWVFAVLGISALVKKLFHAGDEASRKVVHVLSAFAWMPMYICFGATWHLLIPPATFIVINYISVQTDLLPMMERHDGEKSYGTVFYAVSMTVLAAATLADSRFMLPFGAGMLCMALGDGLAPLFGSIKKGNRPIFGEKRTLYGSLSVFALSSIVVAVFTYGLGMPLQFYQVLLVGVFAAVMEAVGVNGADNLTLPLGVGLLSWLFAIS